MTARTASTGWGKLWTIGDPRRKNLNQHGRTTDTVCKRPMAAIDRDGKRSQCLDGGLDSAKGRSKVLCAPN